jgi:hypothetical protein
LLFSKFIISTFLEIEEELKVSAETSADQKIPLNLIITNQNLSFLKNVKSNIFIEIENKYHCSISKKVEVYKIFDILKIFLFRNYRAMK